MDRSSDPQLSLCARAVLLMTFVAVLVAGPLVAALIFVLTVCLVAASLLASLLRMKRAAVWAANTLDDAWATAGVLAKWVESIEGWLVAQKAAEAWSDADQLHEYANAEIRARRWALAAYWADQVLKHKCAPPPRGEERWGGWAPDWYEVAIVARAEEALARATAGECVNRSIEQGPWKVPSAAIEERAKQRLAALESARMQTAQRAQARLDDNRRPIPRQLHISDTDWRRQVREAGIRLARAAVVAGVSKRSDLYGLADREIPDWQRSAVDSILCEARGILKAGHLGGGKFDSARIEKAILDVRDGPDG